MPIEAVTRGYFDEPFAIAAPFLLLQVEQDGGGWFKSAQRDAHEKAALNLMEHGPSVMSGSTRVHCRLLQLAEAVQLIMEILQYVLLSKHEPVRQLGGHERKFVAGFV